MSHPTRPDIDAALAAFGLTPEEIALAKRLFQELPIEDNDNKPTLLTIHEAGSVRSEWVINRSARVLSQVSVRFVSSGQTLF